MTMRNIGLVGGGGFVGRELIARLAARGHAVTLLTRRRERHKDLLVFPAVRLVEGDVHNPVFLERALAGTDAVVSLAGILNARDGAGAEFERVHVELPKKIVAACRANGVPRLLHMSALNASPKGPSQYLRSKGRGEHAVHAARDLQVTSFRPSVIFGPNDSFVNRFAALLRLAPGVFPLACPQSRFQPVYVGDVTECFVRALDDSRTHGSRYNLCGPNVYTLREIVEYVARLLGRHVRIVGLNDFLSRMQAAAMEFAPGKPFSRDNYASLRIASVCEGPFPAPFDITPTALEEIAPRYIGPQAG